MSVTLIDKNDISDHTKRETFWIHALKTASYEINIYLNIYHYLAERAFLTFGHFLNIGLCGSHIELEFWTR